MDEIILVFKFPLVYPTNFFLYKLSLVPNHDNKVLVPAYPYVPRKSSTVHGDRMSEVKQRSPVRGQLEPSSRGAIKLYTALNTSARNPEVL